MGQNEAASILGPVVLKIVRSMYSVTVLIHENDIWQIVIPEFRITGNDESVGING